MFFVLLNVKNHIFAIQPKRYDTKAQRSKLGFLRGAGLVLGRCLSVSMCVWMKLEKRRNKKKIMVDAREDKGGRR